MLEYDGLNKLLNAVGQDVSQQRLWAVRRSVLLAATSHPVRRRFILGFHPAFTLATVLFGLLLGFSTPALVQSSQASLSSDLSIQAFGAETFG